MNYIEAVKGMKSRKSFTVGGVNYVIVRETKEWATTPNCNGLAHLRGLYCRRAKGKKLFYAVEFFKGRSGDISYSDPFPLMPVRA